MGFLYGFIKVTYYELAQDSGVELKIRCGAEIVDRNKGCTGLGSKRHLGSRALQIRGGILFEKL